MRQKNVGNTDGVWQADAHALHDIRNLTTAMPSSPRIPPW